MSRFSQHWDKISTNGLRDCVEKFSKMDNYQLSRDHHVVDHFRKKSIIFRDMRTQGERNAEVRLSISCPSAEKTDSQIYRLKKTDLSHIK